MVHFLSAPAKRGSGTGRRPVEGAAAERLTPSRRRVSMVMIVTVMMVMIVVMMMSMLVIMTMLMIVLVMMDALARCSGRAGPR